MIGERDGGGSGLVEGCDDCWSGGSLVDSTTGGCSSFVDIAERLRVTRASHQPWPPLHLVKHGASDDNSLA
ncbi:hypothetical protein E2C01_084930 [Portunus trituberculatus]|uniref:Uncharacterized protein n=1 Tax=Portunus trituberculatus TaxID=210409 RepID=A0A5B7JC71_PORTR|nr:hypothetical protein [Portunus trituberculatus]